MLGTGRRAQQLKEAVQQAKQVHLTLLFSDARPAWQSNAVALMFPMYTTMLINRTMFRKL